MRYCFFFSTGFQIAPIGLARPSVVLLPMFQGFRKQNVLALGSRTQQSGYLVPSYHAKFKLIIKNNMIFFCSELGGTEIIKNLMVSHV